MLDEAGRRSNKRSRRKYFQSLVCLGGFTALLVLGWQAFLREKEGIFDEFEQQFFEEVPGWLRVDFCPF